MLFIYLTAHSIVLSRFIGVRILQSHAVAGYKNKQQQHYSTIPIVNEIHSHMWFVNLPQSYDFNAT